MKQTLHLLGFPSLPMILKLFSGHEFDYQGLLRKSSFLLLLKPPEGVLGLLPPQDQERGRNRRWRQMGYPAASWEGGRV